jgi:YD repeat-containing protein
MTTYTYDPLVGMTSSTDERNRTTYYIFDDFGRLKEVKDHEGNILQQHDYNYAH